MNTGLLWSYRLCLCVLYMASLFSCLFMLLPGIDIISCGDPGTEIAIVFIATKPAETKVITGSMYTWSADMFVELSSFCHTKNTEVLTRFKSSTFFLVFPKNCDTGCMVFKQVKCSPKPCWSLLYALQASFRPPWWFLFYYCIWLFIFYMVLLYFPPEPFMTSTQHFYLFC